MRLIFVKITFYLKSHRNYLTKILLIQNVTTLCLYEHFQTFWRRINQCETHFDNFIIMVSSPNNSRFSAAEISFCTVEQSVCSILRLIIAHRFFIGLRSGEFPGQSRMVISLSSKNVRIFWKYGTELDPAGKCNYHQKSLFAAQEANETAMLPCIFHRFVIPSIIIRRPRPLAVKLPQNIFLEGCFGVG